MADGEAWSTRQLKQGIEADAEVNAESPIIEFELDRPGEVTLSIYNMVGQLVTDLLQDAMLTATSPTMAASAMRSLKSEDLRPAWVSTGRR